MTDINDLQNIEQYTTVTNFRFKLSKYNLHLLQLKDYTTKTADIKLMCADLFVHVRHSQDT